MALRIGFLGAGLIAQYHSAMVGASEETVVRAGVYDPDHDRATRFVASEGGTVCASEDEVLESCDAVYICTWTSEHRRLVEAACARGLAVFCEKPLATDLAGARAMASVVAEAGVVNQVGLVLRRSPAYALLRAMVADEREHGRPMAVVFSDDQYIPVQGMYASTWRGDPDKAGSGVLLEHSIHDVDILEHVLGPIMAVTATVANDHGIDGIEDGAVATMRFASGAIGTLTTVWHDVLERGSQRHVELFTERSHAVVVGDWFGPVTTLVTGREPSVLEGSALVDEARRRGADVGNPDRAFLRAAAIGEPAWPSFDVALRAHVVVDAIYRAAELGATVELS